MTTRDDIRRICAKLPGVDEGEDRFGFSVPVKGKFKGFIWTWAERIHPKKPRVINDAVLAVLTKNLEIKDMLLASDDRKFFTEPHYNGFPVVLVRLAEIEPEELEDLITEAWRCKAGKGLLEQMPER